MNRVFTAGRQSLLPRVSSGVFHVSSREDGSSGCGLVLADVRKMKAVADGIDSKRPPGVMPSVRDSSRVFDVFLPRSVTQP